MFGLAQCMLNHVLVAVVCDIGLILAERLRLRGSCAFLTQIWRTCTLRFKWSE